MSRTLKLWIATALALIVYLVLTAMVVARVVASGDTADIFRRTLWVIGVLAAAAVLWFRRPAPTPKPPPDDLETLLAAADRTLAQSATSAGGRHRASLATLPAIVVVGPDASVKTTTVTRSGLEPDLLAGAAQQDGLAAPTAALNVWYARGTVFVEAGPPVLAAPERWTRLVRRLQPDRREAVLGRGAAASRAALVCFSCEEFLRGGASDAVDATARTLRARLAELSQQLGVPLPVYVLFTKLDRVSFFADFVQHFSREESVDVLGATLPPEDGGDLGLYEQRTIPRIEAAFTRLFGSLVDRRTLVLRREHAEERRWDAYEFPREFRKLTAPATRFLLELCRPSQLGVSPFLRGFYFSGVQAVVVHDVAPAAVRPAARHLSVPAAADATGAFRALGGAAVADTPTAPPALTPPRKVPRWMFLGRLFEDVLLADTFARGVTGAGERVQLGRRAIAATGAGLAIAAVVAFILSWSRNDDLLDGSADAARRVAASAVTPGVPNVVTLRALDTLRGRVARLERNAVDGAPWWMTFGLYRGDEVRDTLRRAYFDALDRHGFAAVRERVWLRLRTLADTAAGDRYTPTYDLLKAHLMMTAERRRADSAWLAPVLARAWSMGDTVPDSLLVRQLAFYGGVLRSRTLPNPYDSVPDLLGVDRARGYLGRFADSDRIYGLLVSRAPEGLPDVTLRREHPLALAVVQDDYRVPAAFTARGRVKVQDALAHGLERYLTGDEWVLGAPPTTRPDIDALRDTLGVRYRHEYVEHWTAYLQRARVVGAEAQVQKLTGNGSAIFQALSVAARNTNVPDSIVRAAFAPLHAVSPAADTAGYATKEAEPYLDAMQQFATAVQTWSSTPSGQRRAAGEQVEAAQREAETAANALANAAPAGPDPRVQTAVRALLLAPTQWAAGVATRGAAGDLNAAVKEVCEQFRPLEGLYPLSPRSSTDASPRDLKTVLHPANGTLWALVDERMSAFVKRQGSAWVAVADGPRVSTRFVQFLTRAGQLAEALFPNGAPQPQIKLDVEGVTIPPRAEYVTLSISGKTVRFDDDKKRRSASFGDVGMSTPNAEARLVVHYPKREQLVLSGNSGPWAALRLPHDADTWSDYANGGHRASWTAVDPRKGAVTVSMVVRTSEAGSVLRPDQFGTEPLRCPSP